MEDLLKKHRWMECEGNMFRFVKEGFTCLKANGKFYCKLQEQLKPIRKQDLVIGGIYVTTTSPTMLSIYMGMHRYADNNNVIHNENRLHTWAMYDGMNTKVPFAGYSGISNVVEFITNMNSNLFEDISQQLTYDKNYAPRHIHYLRPTNFNRAIQRLINGGITGIDCYCIKDGTGYKHINVNYAQFGFPKGVKKVNVNEFVIKMDGRQEVFGDPLKAIRKYKIFEQITKKIYV